MSVLNYLDAWLTANSPVFRSSGRERRQVIVQAASENDVRNDPELQNLKERLKEIWQVGMEERNEDFLRDLSAHFCDYAGERGDYMQDLKPTTEAERKALDKTLASQTRGATAALDSMLKNGGFVRVPKTQNDWDTGAVIDEPYPIPRATPENPLFVPFGAAFDTKEARFSLSAVRPNAPSIAGQARCVP